MWANMLTLLLKAVVSVLDFWIIVYPHWQVFSIVPFFLLFVYQPFYGYYVCTPIKTIYIACYSHLGEEVALYCSKYLPDIIKEQKTYKDGKLQKVRNFRSCGHDLFMLNKESRQRGLHQQMCTALLEHSYTLG